MTEKKGSAAAPAGEPPEETVTSRDEADEPAGDEDPGERGRGRRSSGGGRQGGGPQRGGPPGGRSRASATSTSTSRAARRRTSRTTASARRARRPPRASAPRAGSCASCCPWWTTSSARSAPPGSPRGTSPRACALVHSELIAVLERNGVEPFDPARRAVRPDLPRGALHAHGGGRRAGRRARRRGEGLPLERAGAPAGPRGGVRVRPRCRR